MSRFLLIILFIISLAIRTYRINDFLFFDYEQGRDAEVIKNIYTLKDLTLVGPKTDIDGFFHGPLFYYLLAIPYFLGQGNPLFASIFQIALCSIIPIIIYYIINNLLCSKKTALISALITTISFESIVYSRWLSNVTLATLFVPISYLFLLKYIKNHKQTHFILSVLIAAIACQFEIILTIQFAFFYCLFIIFRLIKKPPTKTIILSIISIIIIFFPLILFNFRHQNIMVNSVIRSIFSERGTSSIFYNLSAYIKDLSVVINDSLSYRILPPLVTLFFLTGISILIALKNKKYRHIIVFILIWCFMSLPIIPFDKGQLHQLFVGSGFAWIILLCIIIKYLWDQNKTKYISIFLLIPIIFGVKDIHQLINFNEGSFYNTAQEGVNLETQKNVLDYIHNNSNGQPYRFEAFVVPYLHPEGWKYLKNYYYPKDTDNESKLLYIAIEKSIPPFWEKEWIKDIGKTTLIEERQIGKIRVQKRITY